MHDYKHISYIVFGLFLISTLISFPVTAQRDTGAALIEEIVVSARKREELLGDVPVSVTAFTGETIEKLGLEDIEDTYGIVPGLYFSGNLLSPTQNFRQLIIRGVGANSQLDPSVAMFVDGVYAPSIAFDMDFLDVERMEILKGPQGSLFGRNTEGGALNIVTRKPDEEIRARFNAMYDEFNTFKVAGSLSGPISEQGRLYGKLVALYSETDGFINNNTSVDSDRVVNNVTATPIPRSFGHNSIARKDMDESDKYAFAGGLRWILSDAVEVNIAFDYSRFAGGDQAPGPLASCDCYTVDTDVQFDHDGENRGVSFTLDWDMPIGTLTSITGWRDVDNSTPFDMDGVVNSPVAPFSARVGNIHDFDFKQTVFSEELRLASRGDSSLNWLIGLYYFEEENDSDRWYNFANTDDAGGAAPQQFLDGLWNEQIVNIDRTGGAVFGQASYNFNEKIEVSAGARYSYEEAEVEALEIFAIPGANFGLGFDFTSLFSGWSDFVTPYEDRASWNDFSPMVSGKYYWTDNVMTYVTWSQGFKAGSYQKAPVVPADVVPIAPESIESLEFGAKATFFDRRLSVDIAGYFLDLEDMQLQSAIISGGLVTSAITNASSAEVEGVELAITTRPVEQLILSANIGWTNTEFVEYEINPVGTTIVDRGGESFPNTPEITIHASAEYVYPLGYKDWELSTYLSYRYIDETYAGSNSVSVDPIIDVPDWEQLDLRVSLQSEKWRLTAFADNITDEYIVLTRWNPFFIEPNLSFIKNRIAPPRRIGVSFTYSF